MTVGELKSLLKNAKDSQEIFVAHDYEDGEDILSVELDENLAACFIIYKKEN